MSDKIGKIKETKFVTKTTYKTIDLSYGEVCAILREYFDWGGSVELTESQGCASGASLTWTQEETEYEQ